METGCWIPIDFLDIKKFSPFQVAIVGKDGGYDDFTTKHKLLKSLRYTFVDERSNTVTVESLKEEGYELFFLLPETGYKSSNQKPFKQGT